ncbi:hypothetical protein HELRODRAFT_167970 [Helobdella robusta]|uniref:Uncharacterized protein n=1 Tax=Helobdella robusta TaxID=6412 RepID=T1F008_HELRO|nr:hypothetical protein HELRODRAFT_167970 [Helobdella robusta]ESO10111.1 hypothetical protein HELRODRAFT_167970 [Helobdella robusta]
MRCTHRINEILHAIVRIFKHSVDELKSIVDFNEFGPLRNFQSPNHFSGVQSKRPAKHYVRFGKRYDNEHLENVEDHANSEIAPDFFDKNYLRYLQKTLRSKKNFVRFGRKGTVDDEWQQERDGSSSSKNDEGDVEAGGLHPAPDKKEFVRFGRFSNDLIRFG